MRIALMVAGYSLSLLSGCGESGGAWEEDDNRRIYAAVIASVREQVGVDTIAVDPRPRFLSGNDEELSLGDFSSSPDRTLSTAIRITPMAIVCRLENASCSRADHQRFVTVSEIRTIGSRDAGVLATFVEVEGNAVVARRFAVLLREGGGAWRVVRVTES